MTCTEVAAGGLLVAPLTVVRVAQVVLDVFVA